MNPTVKILASLVIGLSFIGAFEVGHAAIYGLRTKNPNTPEQETIRWRTTAEVIQIEVPNHGLIEISVDGEQLVLTTVGDAPDHLPRSVVVRGMVVNQLRLSLER